MSREPSLAEVRRAAWSTWMEHAPAAAQVARDRALSLGWTERFWTKAFGFTFAAADGWPIGIGYVPMGAWRIVANSHLSNGWQWTPGGTVYSWQIGNIGRRLHAPYFGGLFPQARCYPLHKAADRVESIKVLGALLLGGLTTPKGYDSWDAMLATTSPSRPVTMENGYQQVG